MEEALNNYRSEIEEVIRKFYDAVFEDLMIGFYFKNSDRERLIQLELVLVEELLDKNEASNREHLLNVHRPFKIAGGHFDRRQEILRATLANTSLPEELIARWLEGSAKLRPWITENVPGECH